MHQAWRAGHQQGFDHHLGWDSLRQRLDFWHLRNHPRLHQLLPATFAAHHSTQRLVGSQMHLRLIRSCCSQALQSLHIQFVWVSPKVAFCSADVSRQPCLDHGSQHKSCSLCHSWKFCQPARLRSQRELAYWHLEFWGLGNSAVDHSATYYTAKGVGSFLKFQVRLEEQVKPCQVCRL